MPYLDPPPESSGLILLAAQRGVWMGSLADIDAGPGYGDESLAAALRAAAGAEKPAMLVVFSLEAGPAEVGVAAQRSSAATHPA